MPSFFELAWSQNNVHEHIPLEELGLSFPFGRGSCCFALREMGQICLVEAQRFVLGRGRLRGGGS